MLDAITGRLILKRGREKPLANRHPWVFSGAIDGVEGNAQPGDLVVVVDSSDNYVATAYYNPHSQIRARVLTWDQHQPIGDIFWRRRIERAVLARELLALEPATSAYRLIHAEADGLPGLVVDRYGDYLVMQCLTLGIDRRKALLADLLQEVVQPSGMIERLDAEVRDKEGLSDGEPLQRGTAPPEHLEVREHDHRFLVDLRGGHKTGFYLDQRDNRLLLADPKLVAGKRVLNVFAYTGGFAVYAAAGGAETIVNIDTSIPALELAEQNVALNGGERPGDEYIAGDAFEVLRYYRDGGEQFDVVILDPPKFVHSRRDLEKASRGYKDLNWLALRLLAPGGVLATFSCSGLVDASLFQKMVFAAAVDAGREVQILHQLSQGPDHPVLLTFPESAYLKGLLCRVW